MANPVLNDKVFASERVVTIDPTALTPRREATMTIDGVVQKTALLLFIVLGAGTIGWKLAPTDPLAPFPAWVLPAGLGALAVAFLTFFRPRLARITGPLYAIGEGLVAGAISAFYEHQYKGIVLQAVLLTFAVTAFLLYAFATKLIRVTPKFRMMVFAATFAVLVIYLVQLAAHLLGSSLPFLFSSGPIGTLFCIAVCFIAASNLLVDFDFIQRGINGGVAKHMEWYAGFAVCVHLVWLYLELLRLLGRMRSR